MIISDFETKKVIFDTNRIRFVMVFNFEKTISKKPINFAVWSFKKFFNLGIIYVGNGILKSALVSAILHDCLSCFLLVLVTF